MKKKIFLGLITTLIIWGCSELFETDISKEKLVLVAPSNNAISKKSEQYFSWDKIENATFYNLQIATPSFIMVNNMVLDTNVLVNKFKCLLPIGKYEWRVRACNSSFKTEYSTNSLIVDSAKVK